MSLALPSRRLVSQEDSSITARPEVPRSDFHGSWTRKTTFNAGDLVPFMVDEVLPGDHMRYTATAYVRMATPLFPLFDNQRIDTLWFFVPWRLVWDNFVKFMGEQENPGDSIAYTIPQMTAGSGTGVGTLADHFGLPTGVTHVGPLSVNAGPFRAYNLIYNTWFRDQNLQPARSVPKGNGPDADSLYNTLAVRAKMHDYFTSCLPWPQKFTAPTIPVGGLAPVVGLAAKAANANTGPTGVVVDSAGNSTTYSFYKELWNTGVNNEMVVSASAAGAGSRPQVFADLSLATGVAVNTFRQAFMVQSFLESQARGGTRYVEQVWSRFGVRNPDFRLARPEYIGGGQSPLMLTPVAQTAPSTGVPVGALGAAGTASGRHEASYAATEHGFIIALINVRSELSYQRGIARMWSRLTLYDHYDPAFAGLGEQAVLRKEIWATGSPANDDAVFGYQERWHELRTRTSEVTGLMRSAVPSTLDAWHLAQDFTVAPTLSDAFIKDLPPMARVLAAGALANNQQYLADILIERHATRPIPMFGTPVTLGRF